MAESMARPGAGSVRSMTVSGEVDIAAVEGLLAEARACLATDAEILEIDVSAVTFIDSTGLGALVLLSNEAAATGRRVTLTRATPGVVRLLEITGLAGLLADRAGS
jgi:anti-anti-sigma factor